MDFYDLGVLGFQKLYVKFNSWDAGYYYPKDLDCIGALSFFQDLFPLEASCCQSEVPFVY